MNSVVTMTNAPRARERIPSQVRSDGAAVGESTNVSGVVLGTAVIGP
jgi:hypothetical protein